MRSGGEQGLLSATFHPRQPQRLFVHYTDRRGDTRVVEHRLGPAAAARRRTLLRVDQPDENHNGGELAFGPDGRLYLGLGDGGGAGDPDYESQNVRTLLGNMLRVNPRPAGNKPYRVPRGNPFVKRRGARPEIWAYGLRNPWKYSFDRDTGDLWIADVGQNRWEEINLQRARSKGGENYGWKIMEGTSCNTCSADQCPLPVPACNAPSLTLPIHDYGRDNGGSIIGGYV